MTDSEGGFFENLVEKAKDLGEQLKDFAEDAAENLKEFAEDAKEQGASAFGGLKDTLGGDTVHVDDSAAGRADADVTATDADVTATDADVTDADATDVEGDAADSAGRTIEEVKDKSSQEADNL
jgi:hypothetical protein